MPDFIDRFGQLGDDGKMFLSSSRQSIITSLLSAGWELLSCLATTADCLLVPSCWFHHSASHFSF
jgi:hypothetical protein